MAGPEDPFTPGPTADPTAGIPNMRTFENLRNQWSTWIDQPGNRTALLQFGLALATPRFGENTVGAISRSVGEAGEAVTREREIARREEEAASKQDLRASQAQLAEARAGTAGVAAGLQRERLLATKQGLDLQQRVKLALGYGPYEAGVNTRNQKARDAYERAKILDPTLSPPTLEPLLTPDQWLDRQQSLLAPTGIPGPRGAAPGPGSNVPGAEVRNKMTAQDQQALDWANNNPDNADADKIKERLRSRYGGSI